MNETLKLTVLRDVYLTLSTAAGPQRVRLTDVETLRAGIQFRVEATSPLNGFFYVVQIGADHHVRVDYPSTAPRAVAVGDALTVPDARQWLTAVIDGPVRVVISNQPVADSDWPTIDPGRDGDAHTPTGTEGRMVQTQGEIGQAHPVNPPAVSPQPPANPPAKQPSARK